MTDQKARDELELELEQLRVEQTMEDIRADLDGTDVQPTEAELDSVLKRFLAEAERRYGAFDLPTYSPTIPSPLSALRAGWRVVLSALEAMPQAGSATVAVATRRGDDAAGAGTPEALRAALRARLPDDLPEGLVWAQAARTRLASGGSVLTLVWVGPGTPVEPATIELRPSGEESAPGHPERVGFDAEVGTLSVHLPGTQGDGSGSELADDRSVLVATPDAETLVVVVEGGGV